MTFEKALEAMRNGKIVVRKGWDCNYELCMFENAIISYPLFEHIPCLRTYDISACDWEICGEFLKKPLKEPEMTDEHAIEILKSARKSYRYIPDIESVNIEHEQKKYNNLIRNLHILFDEYQGDDSCRKKIKNVIGKLERDTEPEHKCNACHCNCSHTGTDNNLQEEMKQALSRKFFELEEYSAEESYVNCMLGIYNSIFPEELSAS